MILKQKRTNTVSVCKHSFTCVTQMKLKVKTNMTIKKG